MMEPGPRHCGSCDAIKSSRHIESLLYPSYLSSTDKIIH